MPVSDGIEKRKMSIRVPMPLYKKVEAIAQKEKASKHDASDSLEMTYFFLMLLEMGIEEYQDRYGDWIKPSLIEQSQNLDPPSAVLTP